MSVIPSYEHKEVSCIISIDEYACEIGKRERERKRLFMGKKL